MENTWLSIVSSLTGSKYLKPYRLFSRPPPAGCVVIPAIVFGFARRWVQEGCFFFVSDIIVVILKHISEHNLDLSKPLDSHVSAQTYKASTNWKVNSRRPYTVISTCVPE